MKELPRASNEATTLLLLGENANRVLNATEQVENLKVEVLQQDSAGNVISKASALIRRSPHGLSISIPVISTSGGNSSGSNQWFTGGGAPSAATLPAGNYVAGVNPNYYTDNQGLAIYQCVTAGTQATAVWQLITAAVLLPYVITAIAANTLTVKPYNANTSITVYKPPELSGSLASEAIDGNTINYSGYTDTFNERTAADNNGNSELQYITPRYVAGGVIYAMPSLYNLGTSSSPNWVAVLMEISPSRQWGGIN